MNTGVDVADVVPETPAGPASAGRAGRSTGFVAELEGLRGVAILLVVLFHAHLLAAPSGFIGVDVFFVLSGFLITGLLVRELEERGRISLSAFYVRRARRILPASLVVIVLTIAAATFFISPLDMPSVAADGAASALSAGNILFALRAVDYFAQDQAPSPLLHYWSLGVEEQFYLVWPFLFLALGLLASRLAVVKRHRRRFLAAALGVITVVSLIAGIVVTSISQPHAFYLLPTRAWELGLGGLLAIGAVPIAGIRRSLRLAAGWLGLAMIVASGYLISLATPYPGTVALLPTIGSALVIVSTIGSATESSAAPWVLRTRALRFLGLISFSLYLVHWPIVTLAETAWLAETPPDLHPDGLIPDMPIEYLVGLTVLSVIVAAASYRFVERPFHRGFTIRGWSLARMRHRWILANAVVAMILVVGGSLVTRAAAQADLAGGPTGVAEPTPTPEVTLEPIPTAGPSVPPGPGDSGDPLPSVPPSLGPTPAPTFPPVVAAVGPLPPDVQPRLRLARDDWDALYRNGCALNNIETRIVDCVFGDPNGSRTMVLVGDSHAQMWFPALNAIAKANHWRLVPMTKFSCRFFDLPMFSEILQRPFAECETWKAAVLARLREMKPDLTVVVIAHGMTPLDPDHASPVVQGRALARYLGRFPGEKAVIVDVPGSAYDVPACLASHRPDVTACATPRRLAANAKHALLEETATADSGATLVDMTDRICTPEVCPAVIGNMITYRDNQHLTATFARSLAPVLQARIQHLMVE